ncbi:hypothetical protein ACP70R_020533 [Stipagrostis hirtigluma subsp. patula]
MLPGQPMRIFCKASPSLNAAVRGDRVVLVRADPSDESQHWIQDHDSVGRVTDEQGRRAFALVNVATGQALMHDTWDPRAQERAWNMQLAKAPYRGHERVELSKLWSQGVQLDDDGFSEVRVIRNMAMTFNALGGYAEEGAEVGLFNSEPSYHHAIWKIVPINSE